METSTINQPMIIIALSPREAKAALDDPEQMQSVLRREWLAAQGVAPLALPAPESNGHAKTSNKMGGAKRGKKKLIKRHPKKRKGDGREFHCAHCNHDPFATEGFLARHIRQVHPDVAAAGPEPEIEADASSDTRLLDGDDEPSGADLAGIEDEPLDDDDDE